MKTLEEKLRNKWLPYLKKPGRVSRAKVEEFKRDIERCNTQRENTRYSI